MNNTRRKQIQELINSLENIKEQIEMLQEEEQESFDNLPESFQYSERGEFMEEAMNNLEYAADTIDDVTQYLEDARQ